MLLASHITGLRAREQPVKVKCTDNSKSNEESVPSVSTVHSSMT